MKASSDTMRTHLPFALPLLFGAFLLFLPTRVQGWEPYDVLPQARADMCHVTIEDTLYIIGGVVRETDINTATNTVLRYNLNTQEWLDPAPPLAHARIGATAALHGENIYVFGGRQDQESYLSSIEMWRPGLTAWIEVGELLPARAGMRAYTFNDTMYVTGGNSSPLARHAIVNAVIPSETPYQPPFLTQTVLADTLPGARSYHMIAPIGNVIYLCGGFSLWPLNDLQIFYESGWQPLYQLPYGLAAMGYTLLPDAGGPLIVLAGGLDSDQAVDLISTIHTPTGTWREADISLPSPRYGHILLHWQGMLLSIGGSYVSGTGERVLMDEMIYAEPGVLHRSQPGREPAHPSRLELGAYPNPFNGAVRITLDNLQQQEVQLTLRNVLGQTVRRWHPQPEAGTLTLQWGGRNRHGQPLASGIYFLTARAGQSHQTIKLLRLP